MYRIRELFDDIRYGSGFVRISAGLGLIVFGSILYFLIQVITGSGSTPVGQQGGGVPRPTGRVVQPQITPNRNTVTPTLPPAVGTTNNTPSGRAKDHRTNNPGSANYNTFFKLISSGENSQSATKAVLAGDAKALENLKPPFRNIASNIRSASAQVLTNNSKPDSAKKTLWSSNPKLAIGNLVAAIKSGAGSSVSNITIGSVDRKSSVPLATLTGGNILLDRPVVITYKSGSLSCTVDLEMFLPTFLENGSCK